MRRYANQLISKNVSIAKVQSDDVTHQEDVVQ